jgi:hypothetical protein
MASKPELCPVTLRWCQETAARRARLLRNVAKRQRDESVRMQYVSSADDCETLAEAFDAQASRIERKRGKHG